MIIKGGTTELNKHKKEYPPYLYIALFMTLLHNLIMNILVTASSITSVIILLLYSSFSPIGINQVQGQVSRCPDGYHRSPSGDCEQVSASPDLPRCPNGYHRSPSGNCEAVSNLPTNLQTCPVGYQRSASGFCVPGVGSQVVNPYGDSLPTTTVPPATFSQPLLSPLMSGLLPTVPGSNAPGSTESLLAGIGSSNQSQFTTSEPPKGNISRMIDQEFMPTAMLEGLVFVNYESPTIVVLHGDALSTASNYNTNLWKAVDLLRNDHGYNLDKVLINGLGTDANPERFVIVMTK